MPPAVRCPLLQSNAAAELGKRAAPKEKSSGCWPRCLKFRKGEHWGFKVLKVVGGVALVAVIVAGVLTLVMLGAAGVASAGIVGMMVESSSSQKKENLPYKDRWGKGWASREACPPHLRRC